MEAITQDKALPDRVYDRLVEAICDGRLAPGERLTQEGLARELDVSRLPVHQALRRLQADGFVRRAGRRGLEVAPLEAGMVRELYEFRAGLDQVSAGLAARRVADGLRAPGEAIMERGRRAVAAGDVPELIAADMAFHEAIYAAAGNELIRTTMAGHWNHVRRVMQAVLGDEARQDRVWRDHADILEAICSGDPARAERVAREHADRAGAWFETEMARAAEAGG